MTNPHTEQKDKNSWISVEWQYTEQPSPAFCRLMKILLRDSQRFDSNDGVDHENSYTIPK